MNARKNSKRFHRRKTGYKGGSFHRAPYTPTPEQIAATCEDIQSEWGDIERGRRTCYPDQPVDVTTQSGLIRVRIRPRGQREDGPDR